MACVAANATINEILERGLTENSASTGQYLKTRLIELAEDFPLLGDVRGKGLMIGVELVKDQDTKNPAAKEASIVVEEALKRGLMIGVIGTYRQVLRFTPPLTLSREEADISVEIIRDSLKEV